VIVTLPNGVCIRASSLISRAQDDPEPSFGLYLDERWLPSWPAEIIRWPDFGVPIDAVGAVVQIRDAFDRAARGEDVEVGCYGGLGRTGTVLACMAILAGFPASNAVAWVRENYDSQAVETPDQVRWVMWFAGQQSTHWPGDPGPQSG
jgi:hypothetical protein